MAASTVGNTVWSGIRSPVSDVRARPGAKGRKPPGRNWIPHTRPRPSSFCVNRSRPMPATSQKSTGLRPAYLWKTTFTDGCGTTWDAYGSGRSQSISQ